MKKGIEIAVLAVLASLLGYYAYQRVGVRMGGTPSSLLSPYASEEDWMLDTILRDVTEAAAFAHGISADAVEVEFERQHSGNALDLPTIRVSARVVGSIATSQTLSLERSFWTSENYTELARELLGPVPAENAPESAVSLLALLEPRPHVLVAEDARISALLAENVRNASAHEEAAVLLGVLGLREAAFGFDDKRFLLLRMTSHLAMARGLRGETPLSTTGRLGEAMLLALAGRQAAFLDKVREIRGSGPSTDTVDAWVDALYLYATEDWRRSSRSDCLLVRLMRFRAMAASLGTSTTLERLSESMSDDLADWGRVVTWMGASNVEAGGFASEQLGRELAELREVALAYGVDSSPKELSSSLNELPGRLIGEKGPSVLGWGMWAAFLQRNLCAALHARNRLLRDGYGLPDDAVSFGREAEVLFGDLAMDPIVQVRRSRFVGGRVEDTVGMDDSIMLTRRHPELVNPTNWRFLEDTALHMMRKRGMPRGATWLSPAVLATGLLDSTSDRWEILRASVDENQVRDRLLTVAPTHSVVLSALADRAKNDNPEGTFEDLSAKFGDRLDFDMHALRNLLGLAKKPEDRIDLLERMCRLDAEECAGLGWEQVYTGKATSAIATFERLVAGASNQVGVCNNANWLINYYYDHGRRADAVALADAMEGVYCSWGIRSKAYLLERMERYKEAEQLYQEDAERYEYDAPVSPPLLGFYYRMAQVVKDDAYDASYQQALSRIFPNGLEALPTSMESSAPADGVLIDGTSEALENATLRGGDVIVGLDGFRVRTLDQYDTILSFQARPSDVTEMRLRVWRQTQYLDMDTRVRFRRFGARMRTYGTPGPSYQSR